MLLSSAKVMTFVHCRPAWGEEWGEWVSNQGRKTRTERGPTICHLGPFTPGHTVMKVKHQLTAQADTYRSNYLEGSGLGPLVEKHRLLESTRAACLIHAGSSTANHHKHVPVMCVFVPFILFKMCVDLTIGAKNTRLQLTTPATMRNQEETDYYQVRPQLLRDFFKVQGSLLSSLQYVDTERCNCVSQGPMITVTFSVKVKVK